MAELVDPEVAELSALDYDRTFTTDDPDAVNLSLFATDDAEAMKQYFKSAFTPSEKTKWQHEKQQFCSCIKVNGVTDDFLKNCKAALTPTIEKCKILSGCGNTEMKQKDFANIWLNRDFLMAIQDFLNK
jgi:hypothetical protein